MMERDKFMEASEAKEMGLIDKVLTSPPKVGDAAPQTPEWPVLLGQPGGGDPVNKKVQ